MKNSQKYIEELDQVPTIEELWQVLAKSRYVLKHVRFKNAAKLLNLY